MCGFVINCFVWFCRYMVCVNDMCKKVCLKVGFVYCDVSWCGLLCVFIDGGRFWCWFL